MQHASRFRSYRETTRCSLGASDLANLPGKVDARSSLHQDNHKLGGVAYRKHSHRSLQEASFHAQRQVESLPTWMAPTLQRRKRSLSKRTLLGHFALGEQAGQLPRHVPPSPQLDLVSAWVCGHELSQLRAEIATLQEAV